MKNLSSVFAEIILFLLTKKNIVSEPKEVCLKEKDCIGFSITSTFKDKQTKVDIPPFYHDIYDNNKLDVLRADGELKMHCIFDIHGNKQDLDYYVAVENKLAIENDLYSKIILPEGKYVKVELLKKSQKAVLMVAAYIEKVWLKKNGYIKRDTPPFILYDERFHSNYKEYGWDGPDYFGYPLATLYIPVEGSEMN